MNSRHASTHFAATVLSASFFFLFTFLCCHGHCAPLFSWSSFFADTAASRAKQSVVFLTSPLCQDSLALHCLYSPNTGVPFKGHAESGRGTGVFRFWCRLFPEQEELLSLALRTGSLESLEQHRSDGSIFYRRGWRRRLQAGDPEGEWLLSYVPHCLRGVPNPAFSSDLGVLEIWIPAQRLLNAPEESFFDLLTRVFRRGNFEVHGAASPNAYFFQPELYGFARDFCLQRPLEDLSATFLLPNHKMTLNKSQCDRQLKYSLDRDQCIAFLKPDHLILSQDERLRRGMVPPGVKLNPSRIQWTDIGTGQNVFVFLTLGPGINYFDDPWKSPRKNYPAPRFLYSPAVLWLRGNQFYPSYSIDCGQPGQKRLDAINAFQNTEDGEVISRLPLDMDEKVRRQYFENLESALLKYGIMETSEALEPGFEFQNLHFRGNIVNNELRIREFSAPLYETMHMICPPAPAPAPMTGPRVLTSYGETYASEYLRAPVKNLMDPADLMRMFPGGTPWTQYFVEAQAPSDQALRAAYLEMIMVYSQPLLARLLRRSRLSGRPGAMLMAEIISRLLSRSNGQLLRTGQAWQRRRLSSLRLMAWYDFLASLRNKKGATERRLKFEKFLELTRLFWQDLDVDIYSELKITAESGDIVHQYGR